MIDEAVRTAEKPKQREIFRAVRTTSVIFALLFISQKAFSKNVRKAIIKRDGECQWSSETGEETECFGQLEAAHIDHDRDNPYYNHPSNGRALCTACHREDHILNHGLNGLTEKGNKWAITMMTKRLLKMGAPLNLFNKNDEKQQ